MTQEAFDTPQPPVDAEIEQSPYKVGILTEYSPEVAAGIGNLMPQLDENFDSEPTPQDKLERIIASPDRCQIVGYDNNGGVVAAATMNTLMGAGKQTEGWLEDFVVDESVRGSGVATQMWNEMGNWCRSQGLAQFSFGTETKREDAVAFYEKQGAVTDPTSRHLTFILPEAR